MRGVEIPMGKMPYAGEVGCGRQLVLHPEEDLDLPQGAIAKGDFSVKACGDSMNKARIDDGDILIVKRQDWAEDGQIVIANLDWDGATCKRYRVTNEGPYLVPESYSIGWELIPVTKEVTILGVVKAVHRPLIEFG
ncbi:LexA repressor [compost metagenome]